MDYGLLYSIGKVIDELYRNKSYKRIGFRDMLCIIGFFFLLCQKVDRREFLQGTCLNQFV